MPMSSHGSLHQFATLRLKTYILARKERELLVACRPPRGLTPPHRLKPLLNPKTSHKFTRPPNKRKNEKKTQQLKLEELREL